MSSKFTKAQKYSFSAPGTAYGTTGLLQFKMNAPAIVSATWFNIGRGQYYPVPVSGNSITVKIQDCADGVTWADVAGTTQTVVPDGEVKFSATLRPFWRVLAFGNGAGVLEVLLDETLDIVRM